MNKEDLAAIEKQHVWHPFTQMRDWEAEEPLFIEGGSGVKLRDIDGREYWDANSSLWVNIHGHGRPEIDRAITEQLGRISHSTLLGLTHAPAALLAQRLTRIAPDGLTRVFYSDSGSTAVEIALKMAYQYQCHRGRPERSRFIALEESYHGDTIGAVSVGGIGLFHGIFHRLLFPVDFAPCPARAGNRPCSIPVARASPAESSTADCAAEGVRKILEEKRGKVAAVILEPLIQGAGGMLLSPPGFLARVRALCDEFDVLLIVDEVATGFGRTGRMFACEHEGVAPDLMCVAKGITGGCLPLAATLATEEVYSAFLGDYSDLKTFFHGHSYTGNPLACAAALASLDIFENDGVIAGLAAKIERVRERLQEIDALPHVAEVRQCGLMVGMEMQESPGVPYPFEQAMGARVCKRARSLGLITRPLGSVIVFLPPLASTISDLDAMLDIVHTSIRDVTGEAEG